LLGLEYDSRLLAGRDILSDSDGLVVFSSNSWISDKGTYNRFTGKFVPHEGISMTETEMEEYVAEMKTVASCRLQMTSIIIENDYYSLLLE
jgi:lipoteichoic acid synthase